MNPDQIMPVVLVVVMIIVAVILVMVGVQLFFLLKETRATIRSINVLVDNANKKLDLVVNPIRTLGSLAAGVAGGLKVFDSFSGWLKSRKPSH